MRREDPRKQRPVRSSWKREASAYHGQDSREAIRGGWRIETHGSQKDYMVHDPGDKLLGQEDTHTDTTTVHH